MAAHVYSLTDGSTTITLDESNSFIVTGFVLETPEVTTREVTQENVDGAELPGVAYRNVTRTLDLLLKGANTSALQTLARSIDALLVSAHRRQRTGKGPRVYLQIQLDSEASTWRTEILTGRLRMSDEALQQWISKKVEAQLFVTTRFYWEGPETELQLSTSNQSAATGGRTIKNHDDSGTGDDNWVQIASSQIGGDLPTPVKLTLQNTTGGSVGYRNLFLAVNAVSDPANFAHILEGENRKTGYGTVTGDANSSNGNYNAYSFTNAGEIQWDLSSGLMQDTQGRWFRLLARFVSWSGTDIYVKPVLKETNGLVSLWEGDEVKLGTSGSQFVDLGAMPLPVGGYQVAWGAQVLSLVVRATGAATLNLDFIQLTPLDSYRWIVQRGLLIANSGTITDDNIEGITHAGGQAVYSPKTGPLFVFPGVTQRVLVLQDTGSASNITQTFSVRAYIRERRLSV